MPLPIRIVGVGSPNGDDALAWLVVRQLQERADLPDSVECHTVEGGQRLLELLDGTGTLMLVDAMAAGGPPGSMHRFGWPDPRIESMRPGSTHDLRPAEALELASALAILPPRVVVFGIEMADDETPGQVDPRVASAVPGLVQQIANELDEGLETLPIGNCNWEG